MVLLQKVIGYPVDPFACGKRELHATPSMSAIIPLGELHFNLIKRRPDKKVLWPSAIDIHIKVYPTIRLSGRSNLVRQYLSYTYLALPCAALFPVFSCDRACWCLARLFVSSSSCSLCTGTGVLFIGLFIFYRCELPATCCDWSADRLCWLLLVSAGSHTRAGSSSGYCQAITEKEGCDCKSIPEAGSLALLPLIHVSLPSLLRSSYAATCTWSYYIIFREKNYKLSWYEVS